MVGFWQKKMVSVWRSTFCHSKILFHFFILIGIQQIVTVQGAGDRDVFPRGGWHTEATLGAQQGRDQRPRMAWRGCSASCAPSAGKMRLPSLAKQLRAWGFAESSISGRPHSSAGLLLGTQDGQAIPQCTGREWL